MSDELNEIDLISGKARVVGRDEQGLREIVTRHFKDQLGDCDNHCEWDIRFGWVPEACCPVHDPEG